jgi:G3E family GTPase
MIQDTQTNKTLPPLDTSQMRLPVAIITGFLGSGKTTLLNQLLIHPDMQNTAVVINEFGAVSIDHLLVRSATEDIVVMEGGCVCCTVRGDLTQTLQDLFLKRVRLEITEFERVVIETTGLADPAPIIHTLLNDAILKTYFYLDSVITTVDSVYGLDQLEEQYETVKQIAVADRLILTKVDIASASNIKNLRERLQRLNPAALLLESIDGQVAIEKLFNANLYNPATKSIDVQQWLQAEMYADHTSPRHEPHRNEMRHESYIRSFCLTYEQPLSWTVLNRWFQQLTALRGKDLLRVKGIAYTVETDLPVVIQGVHHIFQPPTTLPTWPTEQRYTQIVFITRNISQTVIEQMLAVLVESKTPIEACSAALLLLESHPT